MTSHPKWSSRNPTFTGISTAGSTSIDSREHIYLVVLQRLAEQFEERIYSGLGTGKKTVSKVVDALIAGVSRLA